MSFKNFIRDIQEMKGGIGNISRRSFEVRFSHHHRSRSQGVVLRDTQNKTEVLQQCCWATIPPELLRDIIQRLETSEELWPLRKNVVACAGVCSTWRIITKELVKAPEISGKLTFPITLKQPGPRDNTLQCYIKRDRTTSTYKLYLGLSPTLMENGKFLLAARKFRRATSTDYIVSLNSEDMSRGSSSYVGKLRSNFLGTKFAIYDSQAPHLGAVSSTNRAGRRVAAKQVSPKVPAGSFNVAHIAYELNVLGTRGPRRMQCTLHTIGASSVDTDATSTFSSSTPHQPRHSTTAVTAVATATAAEAEAAAAPVAPSELRSIQIEELPQPANVRNENSPKLSAAVADVAIGGSSESESGMGYFAKGDPLVLKNKSPRWHEQLQCWCLNFRGRVTVASVKNFQLVASASSEPGHQVATGGEQDKVLLQFGKIGKDMFTMDYRYPLSAFQAFAICLSSFDTKLACE